MGKGETVVGLCSVERRSEVLGGERALKASFRDLFEVETGKIFLKSEPGTGLILQGRVPWPVSAHAAPAVIVPFRVAIGTKVGRPRRHWC